MNPLGHLFAIDIDVPWWFQLLVGILPIPSFLKLAIEAAYLIWKNLPWFHRHAAMVELRKSARAAVAAQSQDAVSQWCAVYRPMQKVPA